MLATLWGLALGLAIGAVVRLGKSRERERRAAQGTCRQDPCGSRRRKKGSLRRRAPARPTLCLRGCGRPTRAGRQALRGVSGVHAHPAPHWPPRRSGRGKEGEHTPPRPSRALSRPPPPPRSSPPPWAPTCPNRRTCPAWTSAWTPTRPCRSPIWGASPCRRGKGEGGEGGRTPPAFFYYLAPDLARTRARRPPCPHQTLPPLSLSSRPPPQLPPLPGLRPAVGQVAGL